MGRSVLALDIKSRVDEALFRQLISFSAIPLIGSAACSLVIALAEWPEDNRRLVNGWVGLILVITAFRAGVIVRSRQALAAGGFNPRLATRYAATVGLSGIAWGLIGTLINTAGPLTMVVTITGAQAMVMGGVVTLSAFLPAFLAFALPAIIPMIVTLATRNDITGLSLAGYNLILLVLLVSIARGINRSGRRAIEITFEKEDLVTALTAAHDSLAVLAGTDGLTGLPNRRKFDEALESELARLRRSRAPLSLILIDVDHFKAFNDTYGHVAGDQCLKRIAVVLGSTLSRPSDLAARYGGEEFAAILPETGHAGAMALAQHIRAAIAALDVEHRASPTAPHVTASLGVVTLDCTAVESPQAAIKFADEQLYGAKAAGRNGIRSWNGLQPDKVA